MWTGTGPLGITVMEWMVEVGSTEDEGGPDPGRGGEEEEETRFSLLSLPSVSVTPARG